MSPVIANPATIISHPITTNQAITINPATTPNPAMVAATVSQATIINHPITTSLVTITNLHITISHPTTVKVHILPVLTPGLTTTNVIMVIVVHPIGLNQIIKNVRRHQY